MNLLFLNIISGIFLLFIFLLIIIFDYKDNKKKLFQIKFICLSGILLGLIFCLNIIEFFLKIFPHKIFEIKISIFLLFLISFFCGSLLGFVSGIVNDFLKLLFFVDAKPCLFFTFTSVLWCIMPYYLVLSLSKIYYNQKIFYFYLLIAYFITFSIITAINPIILNNLMNLKLPLWSMYLIRIIKFPITLVINVFLIFNCYFLLDKNLKIENRFKIIKI